MKSYKNIKKKILSDPEIFKTYQELEPDFFLIQKLIEKRLKQGITQASLAKKIGTKQSAVSRFESGTYNPTLKFIYKVADALDIRVRISVR
jgi:DNA-binding XRE family transcriptional regulator